MNTLFDLKQDRSFKDVITTLLTVFAVFAISVATFAVAILSESSSAENGYTATQTSQVSNTHSVDTAGLMLFPSSSLNGALK